MRIFASGGVSYIKPPNYSVIGVRYAANDLRGGCIKNIF